MSNIHHARDYFKRLSTIDLETYPTWDIQKPLPPLPVPDLKETLRKYLIMIEPVIPKPQYQKTREIVEKFGKSGGQGEKLQKHLLEFASTADNWVMDWWLCDMYMKLKLPLPVNSNPGMAFPQQTFKDENDQLRFVARLISGVLDYKVIIDARALPVDRATYREKGQPLCMDQYYRLFTSYRVPGVDKDCLVTNTCKTSVMPEPEHVIVMCRNQLFVLDVVVNFTRLDVDNLYTQLRRIKSMAEHREDPCEPIGVLTSLDRAKWATCRMKLMEDSTNRDCLDLIERCIFVLCLDSYVDTSYNHINSVRETRRGIRDDISRAGQMLHGLGSTASSCNRWFDKTMQFVISEDGTCGLNYEHSPSEGIAVVQLIEHLLKYMEEVRNMKLPRINSLCELPSPRSLHWKTTDDLREDINTAKLHIDSLSDDVDLYVMRFMEFGREFPKTQKMSPDSFIQLALQLTYYKVHGRLVPTYESASIRRFHLGRVDNIRSASPAALEWVRAMVGETPATDEQKMALLRCAIDWQANNLIDTILGYGIDNHLLGLRQISVELNLPEPAIFENETYQFVSTFTLSTSQVPTTMDAFMCYGPVSPDGYGVCYNPHPEYMVVVVASFHSSTHTRSDHFSFTLESTFLQMRDLCLKTQTLPNQLKPAPVVKTYGNGNTVGIKNAECKHVLEHKNSSDLINCAKQVKTFKQQHDNTQK